MLKLLLADLKGENGSAGATLTVTKGLRGAGDLIDVLNLGKDLLSNFTLGNDPKPLYFGLKAAAANGGWSLLGLASLGFPPFSRIKVERRDENPGERTSTRIVVESCNDLRRRLGEPVRLWVSRVFLVVFGENILNALFEILLFCLLTRTNSSTFFNSL